MSKISWCLVIFCLVGVAALLVQGEQDDAFAAFKSTVEKFNQLDDQQKASITQLRKYVTDANGSFNVKFPCQKLSLGVMKKGIVNLVKSHEQLNGEQKESSQLFDAAFQKYVVKPCEPVVHEMNPIKSQYEVILKDQNKASAEFDTNALEWFVNARICLDIFGKLKEVNHIVAMRVLDGKYHKTGVGRLFHKLNTKSDD